MFTIDFLQTIFPSFSGKKRDRNEKIKQVSIDSRKVQDKSLFVPIIGEKFNGHSFIHKAVQNGAIAALWNKNESIPEDLYDDCTFFYVSDTTLALQKLAHRYRIDVNPKVVAVTGSNGKTTTKDLVKSILQTKWRTHATSGNFNNHIGLPLTILQMKRDTEVLVVEMGMNRMKEISVLTKIAKPDYAIITNIGESHIEFLESRKNIAKAKLEIVEGLKKDGLLFIDGDEELLRHMHEKDFVRTCGFSNGLNVVIKNVQLDNMKTHFQLNHTSYTVPLVGRHHAKNASFAIQVAKELGVTEQQIKEGLRNLEHTGMRFELLKGRNGVTIINDAYNASPTSMKAAIDVTKQLAGYKKKGLILGDILELGSFSSNLHRDVAKKIDNEIDFVYTYGNHAEEIAAYVTTNVPDTEAMHFTSKKELSDALRLKLDTDTLLLFKGSRGMKLEEIINTLLADE